MGKDKKKFKMTKDERDKLADFRKKIDGLTMMIGKLRIDYNTDEVAIMRQIADENRKLNDYLTYVKKNHNISNIQSIDFNRNRIISK